MGPQADFIVKLPRASDEVSLDTALLHAFHAQGVQGVQSEFRDSPIHIRGAARHVPPPPTEVATLVVEHMEHMRRFLKSGASCFDLAAYALWWINNVHPYTDGNGRLARGVAFWLLQPQVGSNDTDEEWQAKVTHWHEQFCGEQRREYFDALQEGNELAGFCQCCGGGKRPGSVNLHDFERLANLLKNVVTPAAGNCN